MRGDPADAFPPGRRVGGVVRLLLAVSMLSATASGFSDANLAEDALMDREVAGDVPPALGAALGSPWPEGVIFDRDGDGVGDTRDACPDSPSGSTVDTLGCPAPPRLLARLEIAAPAKPDTPDRADLQRLDTVAATLRRYADMAVSIEAHTDERGEAAENERRSRRWAEAVADRLVRLGVSPARLHARGYGEASPRFQGGSARARERNRRIEIRVIDDD